MSGFARPKIRLCPTGKLAHVTRAGAVDHITRMQLRAKHAQGHAPTRIYQCPRCGWWHTTGHRRSGRA